MSSRCVTLPKKRKSQIFRGEWEIWDFYLLGEPGWVKLGVCGCRQSTPSFLSTFGFIDHRQNYAFSLASVASVALEAKAAPGTSS